MAVTKSPPPARINTTPGNAESAFNDLHVRILRRLTQSSSLKDAIGDAAAEVTQGMPTLGVFYAARGEDGQLAAPHWIIAPPDATVIANPLAAKVCEETLNQCQARRLAEVGDKQGRLLAVGVYFRGRPPEVLGIYAPLGSDGQVLLSALQLAAASISLWGFFPRQGASQTTLADRCIAACQNAESLSDAYQRIVLLLSDASGLTVCLGERRQSGGARLVASSGAAKFSNSTSLARAAVEAMSAILAKGEDQLWVFRDAVNNDPGPVMSFALIAEAEFVFAMPLSEQTEPPNAVLLLFGSPSATKIEPIVTQLRASKSKLAGFLNLLRRVRHEKRLINGLAPITKHLHGANRLFAVPIAAALALLLFLPVTDCAPAECSIEPSSKRFVVSPQDGLLAKSLVEPGATVTKGQELALLDRNALELEIAAQQAVFQQAQLRRDSALARHEGGQAGVFTLEARQAEENLALLELRLDQLTIRSPIDGVVLRGDLKRTLGAPVTKGQVLYEVAPLDEMIAEVSIPEEEIHRIAVGMPVTVRLDAFSGTLFRGTLDRVHPRAELRDEASVFIAEMKLDAHDAAVRPGMRGRASISTTKSAFIWTWIRRPVTRLLRRMGW